MGANFTNQTISLFLQTPMTWNFHYKSPFEIIEHKFTQKKLSGTISFDG